MSSLPTLLSRRGETPARAGNTKVRDGVTFGGTDCCIRSNAGASTGPSETCEMDDKRSSASSPASDGRFACSSDSPPEQAS